MLPLKTPGVLPGFKLSLGLTVLCFSLLVVLPFAMMAAKAAEIGWGGFRNTIAEPNVLAAVRLSLRMSFYAMLTNVSCSAHWWLGCWCAMNFRARAWRTRRLICRLRCRRRLRVSRWRPCMRPTVG
ncbi:sulfate ABC transporter [Neisseria gonorrhoeae FA6140]|nr:sulfate ABC transporter [Neisseria gonorrhoeae FA6140]